MTGQIDVGVPGLRLRFATAADVELILGFIRQRAEHEEPSHEVVADGATLRGSLFGDRRVVEVVIAEDHGAPVGCVLFFRACSTVLARPGVCLEDLFLQPEFRGRGIGKALLAHVARPATQRRCGRGEWSVPDRDRPAIEVYERPGAHRMDDGTVCRVARYALEDLANTQGAE